MAATKATTPPEKSGEQVDFQDLLKRVERLEQSLGGLMTGKVAEISQEERDRITLSRRPNSYPEAVEYEAARERQAERDKNRPKDEETEAENPFKAQD